MIIIHLWLLSCTSRTCLCHCIAVLFRIFCRTHHRVEAIDPPGWSTESNIYWHAGMFTCMSNGFESLHMADHPNRGVFWVRLSVNACPDITLLVATVHFPWKLCKMEVATGIDQRRIAAGLTIQILKQMRTRPDFQGDILVLGGDFNDDWVPLTMLRESGLGLRDVFEAIDCPPPHSHPTRPSHPQEERQPDHTLDWILTASSTNCKCNCNCNCSSDSGSGCICADRCSTTCARATTTAAPVTPACSCSCSCSSRCMCTVLSAHCKRVRGGLWPPPSDHMPVFCVCQVYQTECCC